MKIWSKRLEIKLLIHPTKLEDFIKEYKDKGTQGDFIKMLIKTFETNNLFAMFTF